MVYCRINHIIITMVTGMFFFTGAVFASVEPRVRVLVAEHSERIIVHSQHNLRVLRSERGAASSPSCSATFLFRKGAVEWLEGRKTAKDFWICSGGEGFLVLDGRPYRGKFRIISSGSRLLMINILPLDEYVKGTLGLEASPHWPEEALKAQIIASRTFALRNLGRNESDGYDYCSTVLTQAYGGVSAEHPLTNRLVDETRGLVLTYGGKPIEAVFHSQSGGYTESAEYVWGNAVPYLVAVPSLWEEGGSYENWKVSFSGEELGSSLERAGLAQGTVKRVDSVHHPESGRVRELRITTDLMEYKISPHRFREALGFENFPSTLFQVEIQESAFTEYYSLPFQQAELQKEMPEIEKHSRSIQERLAGELSLDDIIEIIEIRQKERELKRSVSTTESLLPITSPPPVEQRQFVLKRAPTFIFRGKGYGHGVGLSQLGAIGMAENGFTFEEILLHYYHGCEIRRIRFR